MKQKNKICNDISVVKIRFVKKFRFYYGNKLQVVLTLLIFAKYNFNFQTSVAVFWDDDVKTSVM